MATIEEVIDNIVDEHKECRWMDASELREYLEVVAKEQKSIDDKRYEEYLAYMSRELTNGLSFQRKTIIDEAIEWFGNYLMEIGYPDDWMRDSSNIENGEMRFRKAMEK